MTFRTERLEVKPLDEKDLPKLVDEINNFDIAKYVVHVPHPYTMNDAENYYKRSIGNQFRKSIYYQGNLIGAIGLNPKEEGIIEVGYWIGANHWRQGFATEALKGMVNHININFPEIKKIVANYVHGNSGSEKVLKSCGFKVVGEGEVYMLSQDKNLKTTFVELDTWEK